MFALTLICDICELPDRGGDGHVWQGSYQFKNSLIEARKAVMERGRQAGWEVNNSGAVCPHCSETKEKVVDNHISRKTR